MASGDEYKRYRKSASHIPKEMKKREPEKYCGDPTETQAWHRTAAQYAGYARDKYRRAIDAREGMAQDYIGYDKPGAVGGHRKRVRLL